MSVEVISITIAMVSLSKISKKHPAFVLKMMAFTAKLPPPLWCFYFSFLSCLSFSEYDMSVFINFLTCQNNNLFRLLCEMFFMYLLFISHAFYAKFQNISFIFTSVYYIERYFDAASIIKVELLMWHVTCYVLSVFLCCV